MTRGSIREYTEAVRGRYLRTSKKEKGEIFDEFTNIIGCHRKAAIRLLRRGNQATAGKKHGRPWQYSPAATGALRVVWEKDKSASEVQYTEYTNTCLSPFWG